MFKELLEQMDKLAAEIPPEDLERLASKTLNEVHEVFDKLANVDDLAKDMALYDLINMIANDAGDEGRTQGILLGSGGTLGALALHKYMKGKKPLTKSTKRLDKKSEDNDMYVQIEKVASAPNFSSMLEEFTKLAENVAPEELEVIAAELIEKEAWAPFFRMMTGIGGAIRGARMGRQAYKGAKRGLKDYNKGYGTLPRNQRGGIPQPVQQQYQADLATVNRGYWGNIKQNARVGRDDAIQQYDAVKQQVAIDNYNLRAGYNPKPPQAPMPPQPPQGVGATPQPSKPLKSKKGSKGKQTPPPQSQGTPWHQQAGQWIQQNPYLATAAGIGAGMMLPRMMAGANAAANARMMVPAAPYAPYPYYR